jgi:protein-disulfide isomerase
MCLVVAPSETRAQAMTRQQADAILQELKEIRQLLQQLVKANPPRPAPTPTPPARVKVNASHTYALGRVDAPLTLVEFTDYQCPFCLRFHSDVFEQLKKNYIDTGKLRFISRDLPLGFHANAMGAARAARCAGEQGKFWEMRNVLINNAKDLASESVVKYAQGVGLEMVAFRACLDSEKYKAEIQQDITEASSLGIAGTPTFVLGRTAPDKIEGTRFVGVQPLAFFEARIKELQPK